MSYTPLTCVFFCHQERTNGNQGGPTQRASALAALNSAFNTNPSPKPSSATRVSGTNQGSQRAAAVAALSSVLTAEAKRSPDASPSRPSRSPPSETSSPGNRYIVFYLPSILQMESVTGRLSQILSSPLLGISLKMMCFNLSTHSMWVLWYI